LKLKRADGGYDDWEDKNDPDYRRELVLAYDDRERALWAFYVEQCLDVEPPADWRESEAWLTLERAGVKARSLKLDWIEYEKIQTPADEQTLRNAFREVNEGSVEDRESAEDFFGVQWDGVPVREAAQRLKRGKLTFNPGFAQFKVAVGSLGLLPLAREELPPDLAERLAGTPLYFDLPASLRVRMEVFCELDLLAEALKTDEVMGWKPYKGGMGTAQLGGR
jgi:hypothetical protein